MKKLLFLLFSMNLLVACGGSKATTENAAEGSNAVENVAEDATIDLKGAWLIEEAMGASAQGGDSEAFIEFKEDGQLNGNASVNSFFGEYVQDGANLKFNNVGMTRMMGQSMEIERAITDAINTIATIKMVDDKLQGFDAEGKLVLVMKKK